MCSKAPAENVQIFRCTVNMDLTVISSDMTPAKEKTDNLDMKNETTTDMSKGIMDSMINMVNFKSSTTMHIPITVSMLKDPSGKFDLPTLPLFVVE